MPIIYEIIIKKGKSTVSPLKSNLTLHSTEQKEIELRLLEEGNARNAAPSCRSVATQIPMGLAIEEAQITLLIEV
jgi:hypothetical protein